VLTPKPLKMETGQIHIGPIVLKKKTKIRWRSQVGNQANRKRGRGGQSEKNDVVRGLVGVFVVGLKLQARGGKLPNPRLGKCKRRNIVVAGHAQTKVKVKGKKMKISTWG